jgi:hypothetical protein
MPPFIPHPAPLLLGALPKKFVLHLLCYRCYALKISILPSLLNFWAKPPLGEGIENLALHHVQKVPMHGQVAA